MTTLRRKYKKNYLTEVILQLRFPPVESLRTERPAPFEEQVRDRFPVAKEMQEVLITTTLSQMKDLKADMQTVQKAWTFFAADEAKSITVKASEFTLVYRKYEHMEAMQRDFNFLWGRFQSLFHVPVVDRVGLRYINQIVLPAGDPLDWKGYLAPEVITATLGIASPEGHRLGRSLNTIAWFGEDHQLVFKFGVWNSDYPNPCVKREFVLDYDCFSIGSTDAANAESAALRYNELIHEVFERSIGDALRAEMGIVNNGANGAVGATSP